MNYKSQIFIGEVLQCLVDKCVITYQNIWSEGMIRSHLVESSYCKILVPLKGMSSLNHFLHKKIAAAIQRRISKILKLTNISTEKGSQTSDKTG